MNNDLNEPPVDVESQQVVLNIMCGLDDVKQNRFSDKTILDIAEEEQGEYIFFLCLRASVVEKYE